ncbi:MAG: GNAT family N-acetyltransferase, partial [Chloroflexi bacterium]
AFDLLAPRGMAKFLLARVGDQEVATSVELLYRGTIYGWYGGVDRAYSRFTPGELLTWYILRWGAEHGYRVYDFGGAGRPGEPYGVRDFKARFGGRLVCYGRNTYIHAPRALRLAQAGYALYRKVRWRSR